MLEKMTPFPRPDLSPRLHSVVVSREMLAPPHAIYLAWTEQFDRWLAEPGTVSMRAEPGLTFYFEATLHGALHPHYGRFLDLEVDRRIELTWVTPATGGYETVVSVGLSPKGGGALLRLTHAGFSDIALRDRHRETWPSTLALLDARLRPFG
jgi:uncharacterized protein YndB with AHSA1/START domain